MIKTQRDNNFGGNAIGKAKKDRFITDLKYFLSECDNLEANRKRKFITSSTAATSTCHHIVDTEDVEDGISFHEMQLFTLPITSVLKPYILPAGTIMAEAAVIASAAVAAAVAAAEAAAVTVVAKTEDVDDWLGLGEIDYADD